MKLFLLAALALTAGTAFATLGTNTGHGGGGAGGGGKTPATSGSCYTSVQANVPVWMCNGSTQKIAQDACKTKVGSKPPAGACTTNANGTNTSCNCGPANG